MIESVPVAKMPLPDPQTDAVTTKVEAKNTSQSTNQRVEQNEDKSETEKATSARGKNSKKTTLRAESTSTVELPQDSKFANKPNHDLESIPTINIAQEDSQKSSNMR